MTGKRRPLTHSPSLFKPPLSHSSHSAPNPQSFASHKPPLFSSSSESKYSCNQSGSRRTSNYSQSPSPLRTSSEQRSFTISAQASEDKSDKKSSVTNISHQISSFVSLSSQLSLHVAQTVVSDLLTSPRVQSNSLDPNSILDCLINQIKDNLKQGYERKIYHLPYQLGHIVNNHMSLFQYDIYVIYVI
jgi:hypothetical protein